MLWLLLPLSFLLCLQRGEKNTHVTETALLPLTVQKQDQEQVPKQTATGAGHFQLSSSFFGQSLLSSPPPRFPSRLPFPLHAFLLFWAPFLPTLPRSVKSQQLHSPPRGRAPTLRAGREGGGGIFTTGPGRAAEAGGERLPPGGLALPALRPPSRRGRARAAAESRSKARRRLFLVGTPPAASRGRRLSRAGGAPHAGRGGAM